MTQQINLFNPIFLKQKKTFSAVNMLDAMAVLLVGVALFYGYASIQTLNLDRQSVETARQYYQSKARLTEASERYAPKKANPALAEEVESLQAQVNARKANLQDLGASALGGGAGYAEYMRALARQSLAGLWLTGFSVGDGAVEMEISGRALHPELVPAYIRRLAQEPALRGRAFDSLSMTQRDGTLSADPARPGTAVANYVYTEFRLVSSHAGLTDLASATAATVPGAASNPARAPQ
ncbi:MAG: PilN domain-containing protein [Burkholderiales bacterium]